MSRTLTQKPTMSRTLTPKLTRKMTTMSTLTLMARLFFIRTSPNSFLFYSAILFISCILLCYHRLSTTSDDASSWDEHREVVVCIWSFMLELLPVGRTRKQEMIPHGTNTGNVVMNKSWVSISLAIIIQPPR